MNHEGSFGRGTMASPCKFSYDSAEEDWDLTTLQFLNSQLEDYVKMVRHSYIRQYTVCIVLCAEQNKI